MKKGFTLIELLIVITIIGILAVVFLPTVLNAPAKARDAQRMAAVSSIMKAIETGRLTATALPASGCVSVLTDFDQDMPNGLIPVDPSPTSAKIGTCDTVGQYTYEKYKSGYGVYVDLENDIGNVTCASITKGGDAVVPPALTESKVGCYGGVSI